MTSRDISWYFAKHQRTSFLFDKNILVYTQNTFCLPFALCHAVSSARLQGGNFGVHVTTPPPHVQCRHPVTGPGLTSSVCNLLQKIPTTSPAPDLHRLQF